MPAHAPAPARPRTRQRTPARTAEQAALLSQIEQVAQGLAATFAPFCEVVVHDLLDPKHSILAIHNNLSGRMVGDPTTEMGLTRIADPDYPQMVANYANQFADGRPAKSTSVGIKDASGHYIAALCLNVDMTLFRSLQSVVGQFIATAQGLLPDQWVEALGWCRDTAMPLAPLTSRFGTAAGSTSGCMI